MIRYTLVCERKHDFESWFQNSAAFDKQTSRRLVTCPICGSSKVEKAIMAPSLARKDKSRPALVSEQPPATSEQPSAEPGAAPQSTPEKAPVAIMSPQEREFRSKLKELRDHLTKNADYVGQKFPEEARKMHYGEIEHRSIYGEAAPDEAKALIEEGVDVLPLPVLPEDRN